MGDGQVERYNRTLLDMLGTLSAKEKHDWKEQVAPIVHAYNYTRNSSTGDSPFHLMYRRQPRLPVDLALGVQEEVQAEEKSYHPYMKGMKDRLAEAYRLASSHVQRQPGSQKHGYARKRLTQVVLESGDRVLEQQVGFKVLTSWPTNGLSRLMLFWISLH